MDGMKPLSVTIAALSTRASTVRSPANALHNRDGNNIMKTAIRNPQQGPHSSKNIGIKVAFSPKVRVTVIPSHHDMAEDVKASIWRTPEEARANDAEAVEIIRSARRGQSPMPFSSDDPNHCTRGLENLLTQTAARRLRTRRMGLMKAILGAQDKEWQEGSLYANPELLRNISA